VTYSRFACRQSELNSLAKRLDLAVKGEGQILFVTGEAGTGKTAILKAFARQAQSIYPDLVVAFGGCHAHTGICDPYLPFREMLLLLTGDLQSKLAHSPVDNENRRRIKKLGAQSAQILIDVAPALIGVFIPGVALVGALGKSAAKVAGITDKLDTIANAETIRPGTEIPTIEQANIFEQYTNYLQNLAFKQPLLVMIDDLQWADAPSIGLFYHLSRCIEGSKILLIGTYRPVEVSIGRAGNRHPLERVVNELNRYYGDIEIDLHLALADEGRKFIDDYLDTEPNHLNQDFREALYDFTGGHPLFTIELLRAMQERGDIKQDEKGYLVTGPTLEWDALPARVEAVVRERIRRLDQELFDILSTASVEGESFIAQVIANIENIRERDLLRNLSQGLVKRHRLLREIREVKIGNKILSNFKFSHIMIQQYLYKSVGAAERRYLHGEIAAILERLYFDRTDEIATILAHHYTRAGKTVKAVEYSLMAGQKALRLSAYQEAILYLTDGLSQLKTLPNNAERNQLELRLQITLGPALMAIKGHSVPEVADVYTRALELCRQMGDTQYLFPVLFRLSGIHLRRGEFQVRQDVGKQLFSLAHDKGDPDLLLQAHLAQGLLQYYFGDFVQARENFERVVDLYNTQIHFAHAFIYGKDPCVTSLNLLSQVLWYLGYPDKALRMMNDSLSLARRLKHPFSLGYALVSAAILHTLRREGQAALEQAEEAINLSKELDFGLWLTAGNFHRGLALTEQGMPREGISLMHQSLADWRAGGAELGVRNWPGLLIEKYKEIGQIEKGLKLLSEELTSKKKSREGVALSELYRIDGELMLIQGANETEVEKLFWKAIEVSRGQEAKSLELRAVMSLSRLWLKQGKWEEAFQILDEIYSQFTEGFDTPDLIEANALLEEISLFETTL
jgi:predicted ATPase